MKRNLSILAVLVFVLMSFAFTAYADEEVVLPTINDGRINAFDIDAPVAIFPTYVYPYADDVNMGVLERLEFWGIVADGTIDKVLEVTAQEISAADNVDARVLVAFENGYSLYRETDGSLTLVAPTNYQFNWDQSYSA